MSIKFSVTQLKNPLKREEPGKYYAKAQVREIIGLNRVVEEIAFTTSLSEGDVLNVYRSTPHCIAKHLADGDLVDLEDLGRFQFQLQSEGTETRKEFTKHNIKRARLQFRPGKLLLDLLRKLDFEEVIPVKTKTEVKRKIKNEQA